MASAKASKSKGRLGQQEIRDKLLAAFPEFEAGDIKSTTMGEGGADVQLSPAAFRKLPLSIEVKRRKSPLKTIHDWLAQARTHTTGKPVVFYRADRGEWLTILPTDDYIQLLKDRKSNVEQD
jgi:hypothetical protein